MVDPSSHCHCWGSVRLGKETRAWNHCTRKNANSLPSERTRGFVIADTFLQRHHAKFYFYTINSCSHPKYVQATVLWIWLLWTGGQGHCFKCPGSSLSSEFWAATLWDSVGGNWLPDSRKAILVWPLVWCARGSSMNQSEGRSIELLARKFVRNCWLRGVGDQCKVSGVVCKTGW